MKMCRKYCGLSSDSVTCEGVRKAKQRNMKEWEELQEGIESLFGVGIGGVSVL